MQWERIWVNEEWIQSFKEMRSTTTDKEISNCSGTLLNRDVDTKSMLVRVKPSSFYSSQSNQTLLPFQAQHGPTTFTVFKIFPKQEQAVAFQASQSAPLALFSFEVWFTDLVSNQSSRIKEIPSY